MQYYAGLFGQQQHLHKRVRKIIVRETVTVDNAQRQILCRSFTFDDVKQALFDIDETKAPGPDGYTSGFFKKLWNCIVENFFFTAAILDFLQSGKLFFLSI